MKSRWYHLKEEAIILRENGISMTVIERKLGIPRSTLSHWFRSIELTDKQKAKLLQSKADGWAKARIKAVEWHNAQKAIRQKRARNAAQKTLDSIPLTDSVLDLAFAMLYLGEGAKGNTTSIANSDPKILRFVLAVLRRNYNINSAQIRCDLHLRADQDIQSMKEYWSEQLNLPIECFKHTAIDKRTIGKPTYDHYKGVCVISCGNVAIQRKIMYLYNLFCDKVAALEMGA